jgi:hypothetical protein
VQRVQQLLDGSLCVVPSRADVGRIAAWAALSAVDSSSAAIHTPPAVAFASMNWRTSSPSA